jgi:hypothetical protein
MQKPNIIMEQDCIFHCVERSNETLTFVSLNQFNSAKSYSERWETRSEGLETNAAIKFKKIEVYKEDLLCHFNCYKRFCNKLVLERAETRERKRRLAEEDAAAEASKVRWLDIVF